MTNPLVKYAPPDQLRCGPLPVALALSSTQPMSERCEDGVEFRWRMPHQHGHQDPARLRHFKRGAFTANANRTQAHCAAIAIHN